MEPSILIRSGEISETLRLSAFSTVIGRSRSCDVVLPDTTVSGHHIRIVRQGKVYVLREMEAKNGTFVNGVRLRERILRPGDEIRIGRTTIVFQAEAEAPSPPAPGPASQAAAPAFPSLAAQRVSAGGVFAEVFRSVPAYLFSVAVHALILFLFMSVIVGRTEPKKERSFDLSLVAEGDRDLEAPLVEPKEKNEAVQNLFTAPRITEEPTAPVPDPLEKPAKTVGKDQPDEPLAVALAPDKLAVKVKTAPRSKPDSADATNSTPAGGTLDLRPGEDVAGIVLGRLKDRRPGDFEAFGSLKRENIVVITGVYDHVEHVLEGLRIPHLALTPKKFDRTKTDATCAILVDCPGFLNGTEIARIRKWVEKGGYLFTTDWALASVEKMFPGYIRQGGKQTAEDWVGVAPVKAMEGHVLLKDVFSPLEGRPQWWLEEGSFPIQVIDPAKVQVLVDSSEMKRRYGEGAVAVVFEYGQGKVLHVCSHFYQVSTDPKTHYSMTQLIVNFLLEAKKVQPPR